MSLKCFLCACFWLYHKKRDLLQNTMSCNKSNLYCCLDCKIIIEFPLSLDCGLNSFLTFFICNSIDIFYMSLSIKVSKKFTFEYR